MLLLEQGYAATTMTAVANAAGVSDETIYKTVGGKAALVKAVRDITLVGDDEPVPLAQRPEFAAIYAEPDPRQKSLGSSRWARCYSNDWPLWIVDQGARDQVWDVDLPRGTSPARRRTWLVNRGVRDVGERCAHGYGPAMTSGPREPDPRPTTDIPTNEIPATETPANDIPAGDIPAGTPSGTTPRATARRPGDHVVEPTRTSGVWVASIAFAVLLLLLLIFILQNNRSVPLRFLGFDGSMPLGVAMLLAAVLGALLVAMAGVARVLQLRRVAKRHRVAERR
jgi:lipopolysaccharide assembly protein A